MDLAGTGSARHPFLGKCLNRGCSLTGHAKELNNLRFQKLVASLGEKSDDTFQAVKHAVVYSQVHFEPPA